MVSVMDRRASLHLQYINDQRYGQASSFAFTLFLMVSVMDRHASLHLRYIDDQRYGQTSSFAFTLY